MRCPVNSITNITNIFDFDSFQTVQDTLALVTGLAIVTVCYKGNPLTNHSNCSKFCSMLRENPLLSKYCERCDSRGGLEAARINAPYTYLCHYNLVDLAIPIIVDDKYIGAIMAGQVRLIDNGPDYIKLEQITPTVAEHNLVLNMPPYQSAYNEIPTLKYEDLMSYANLIKSVSDYIVKESIRHIHLMNSSFKLESSVTITDENNVSLPLVANRISKQHISTHKSRAQDADLNVINPILEYIKYHPNAFFSSSEAARICNVSPSYFSKIFKRVMKIGYIEYITNLKIRWAKEFLTLSNRSVEQISETLEFTSTSYFIKTFKKCERMTPSAYRHLHKADNSI